MRILSAAVVLLTIWLGSAISTARAEGRLALLIGNQAYAEKVGPLKNPHNDIALIGAALHKLGFKITLIKDAGYKAIDTALRRHIQEVRRAGKDTVSFVYYSGHGAADPDTQINYLIPVDVSTADDTEIWTNSIELRDIANRLREQSPEATHYVVFDACRDELRLTRGGKKALGLDKGFVPVGNISGVMIAYATAPGKTASDVGEDGGPYAKALAEEIIKPGIESVTMFRNVQLKVKQAIGQDPWLSLPTLPAVYFAGTKPSTPTPDQQMEFAFWASVKDSTSPTVLGTYLARYPKGEFAPIANALIENYERQLKAQAAAREEEKRRQEEERKAAEVRRLEDERRVREVALAEERKRAETANNSSEASRLDELQRTELKARSEELRKALEEARLAREAAKAAEEQRLAAVKAAEEATRQAEQAIALKRDSERHSEPAKVAALPNMEKPQGARQFDGVWSVISKTEGCKVLGWTTDFQIADGTIKGAFASGRVSAAGKATWKLPDRQGGGHFNYSGTFEANGATGTFSRPGTRCGGTFTARRY